MINKIVLIGAGNLATHLTIALNKSSKKVVQIYSRTRKSAKELADKISCKYTNNILEIDRNSDLYIIAVSDKAIENLLKTKVMNDKFIVHTAGSVNMNIFKNYTNNYGVFYPLQTFSKKREVDFSEIPMCIEANNDNNLNLLKTLSSEISKDIRLINSEQRKQIHLSAVFACNFVNHMYSIAYDLLEKNDVNFDILKPLITETTNKIYNNNPHDLQTGPAIRNDKKVIKNHIELLSHSKKYKKLYSFVSKSIYKFANKLNK